MKFKTLWLSGAVFQTNLEHLKPKPSYKALFLLNFEKEVCLKRTSCLEVSSIASLQICRINQNWNLEIVVA